MRKMTVLILSIFILVINLNAEYEGFIPRTSTIDSLTLEEIRDACNPDSTHPGYDYILRNYWSRYIDVNNKPESFNDRYNDFGSYYYAREAFWGGIGNDMPIDPSSGQQMDPSTKLEVVKSYLLGPEPLFSLNEVFSYMDGSDGNSDSQTMRGLSLGSILYNVSIMCDMLWFFEDGNYQEELAAKLDSIAWYTYDTVLTNYINWCCWSTDPPNIIPTTGWTNGKLRLIAGLGYAGCVLKDFPGYENHAEIYYEKARGQLFEYLEPTTDKTFDDDDDNYISGYMDACFGDGSGLYKESFSYYSWSMEFLTTFFTAAKRTGWGDNFYNENIIVNAVNENIKFHGPDFSGLPINDCWRKKANNVYKVSERLLEFYYQNENAPEVREKIRWFFNAYREVYGDELPYFSHESEATILSYNPNRSISGSSSIPDYVSNGSYYDNSEFTIIRPEMTNPLEYNQETGLYISHENTYAPSHNQDDQTSFSFFVNGKYFLIDPGYRTGDSGDWLNSAYAHNLIIVNPDSVKEKDNLIEDGYWNGAQVGNGELNPPPPYGRMLYWPDTPSDPYYRNLSPANRICFLENENISSAKIQMSYCLPEGYKVSNLYSYDVDIERNFFMIDDSYYIVYDKLDKQSGDFNDYRNQLHFAEYNNNSDNQNLTYTGNGLFTFHDPDLDNNIYLHGILGAACDFDTYIDEELPMGWKYSGAVFNYRHRRIRLEVSNSNYENEQFLTILFPSESSTNPITNTIKGNGYYAVEVYDESKTPIEKSYYAVSDTLLDVVFADINIRSDKGFEGLTYRPGYQGETKITQFIKTEGDSLFYNDILLFKAQTDIEEVMASYSGTELDVIVKSDAEFPQYKILRQGVQPSNFTSIGVENKENGSNNISNIWYDDDYFYVNWYNFTSTPVNLVNSIYVPEGDVLSIGDGVTVNCLKPDVKIEIDGGINIGDSVTFTCPDSITWDGLYLNNEDSNVIMENVTFERGKVVSKTYQLELDNCGFTDSEIEHDGVKLYADSSNFEGSGIYAALDSGKSPGQVSISIVDITNSSFSDYSGFTIEISDYYNYNIVNNTISQCNKGISLFKCGNSRKCTISNNLIENNPSGPGIQFYNSYVEIEGHNVIRENSYGVVGLNKCNFEMIGSENYPLQRIYDNTNEEIIIEELSYPQEIICNSITDDNYDIGQPDQYLMKCMDDSTGARTLDAEWNYWGSTSLEWGEWDGDDRFYPNEAFDYLPVWDPGSPRGGGDSDAGLLYTEADSLVKEKEYENAKTTYHDIIDFYPLTDYAVYSMLNLFSLETISGQNFTTLRNYYLTDPNCNINVERTKLSEYLANYCRIKMEQYPEAISFFEDIISDPETELDSVFAVIDAGYVYTLMGDNKTGYVGKLPELKPKSKIDFVEKRDNLIDEILLGIEPEEQQQEEIPEYTVLNNNSPNPFNNSTEIEFAITPNTKKVELKIYNIKGQLVKRFDIDNETGFRSVTWDGTDNYGREVGSGVYFYRLKTDTKEFVKKMLLIK